MMSYTNRHFRYLLRLISKHAVLYTEMIHVNAVIYGDRNYLLDFSEAEHPVAIQLGGSNPILLAQAAILAEKWGYDEINFNVGCPSERVQSGCFGAALMKEANLVSECMQAMRESVSIPVTIKTRLGVDDDDSDYFLQDFVGKIMEAGCDALIMHARKAWLSGLSPKENRTIPPLQYDRVYQLKKIFPSAEIIINGGITNQSDVFAHLNQVDGVMLGRAICDNPYWLVECDQRFYAEKTAMKSHQEIVAQYLEYILKQHALGVPLRNMTRHLIGLFKGEEGARAWRRTLSEPFSDAQLIRAIEKACLQ